MAVLLVTGAARGIGADIALLGAERGWDVAVNYAHNQERARDVCERIEALGRRALPVQADVADPQAVEAMFDTVRSELGPLSGLVNNAGVNETAGPIEDLDLEHVKRALEVNLYGVFLHILADALGSVAVIISSIAIKYWGAYIADPISCFLISILILASVVPLVKSTSRTLILGTTGVL